MKDYFLRLFNFDQYANHKIAETIRAANDPDKPVQLMAHLLTAEQVWLRRCEGKPTINIALWPGWQANEFEEVINETHQAWITYLNTLTSADFDRDITYKNSAGDEFTTKLVDILAHVINHGTHTRAQAGQHLKLAGIETLPATDYSFYLRTLN